MRRFDKISYNISVYHVPHSVKTWIPCKSNRSPKKKLPMCTVHTYECDDWLSMYLWFALRDSGFRKKLILHDLSKSFMSAPLSQIWPDKWRLLRRITSVVCTTFDYRIAHEFTTYGCQRITHSSCYTINFQKVPRIELE